MLVRVTTAWGVAALVAASVSGARAAAWQGQAPPEAGRRDAAVSAPEHRGLSLLLNGGSWSGFGGGLAFGTRAAGLRASVGWAPLLMTLDKGTSTDLKFYSGLLVAPDAYLRVLSPQATSDIGAVLGYRYSSLLGHGLAIGAYAQFGLSRSVDLNLSFGLLVFPDGADRLRRDQNLPSSTQFSFPGPNVSLALGASFAFFP